MVRMDIMKSDIDSLIAKTGYQYENRYSDKEMNKLYNYWSLFDDKEKDILELTNFSLDTILYSKYYWCSKFMDRFREMYGEDAGFEQQQYQILEEMDREIPPVNWELIQRIEENRI